MSDTARQVYGWFATIILLLLGYGVYGVVTNSDSAAYQAANKELVNAKVIST